MSYPGPEQWMCENDSNGEPGPLHVRYVEMRQRRDDAHDVGLWLGGMSAPADVIAAQERVLQALEAATAELDLVAVRKVVERYGRVWAKDSDYYNAAEALGIKEPPDA